MRRRFENVNMVMGNCFSPVMEGSQFQWNNLENLIYPKFCLMYHLIVIL